MKPTQYKMIAGLNWALKILSEQRKVGWYAMRDPSLFWVQPLPPEEAPPDLERTESLSHWRALAYELSLLLGGCWWYSPASITWCYGPFSLFLQASTREQEIWEARAITYETTRISDLPFSVAGCARTLINWVGIEDKTQPNPMLMKDLVWNYQHCTPGRVPQARLYDVKACYGTLLRRLPSPIFTTRTDGKIGFVPLPRATRDRWRKMTEAVLTHKGLRNSIIGNMAGVSTQGKGLRYYCRGESRPGPKMGAKMRSAAYLIVRTAYELCAEAVAETRAIYANVDSIITECGAAPRAWERHGLKVDLRAYGEADIKSIGVYRVGNCEPRCFGKKKCDHKTAPYKSGEDHYGKIGWYEWGNADDAERGEPALRVTVKGPHWAQWLDGY